MTTQQQTKTTGEVGGFRNRVVFEGGAGGETPRRGYGGA